MGRLKPIGSEKLTGQAKIDRMLEIARFNESIPQNINETSRSEYSINLVDGNKYEIVKERQGYIIKKMITETESDYIEPMKNRKYYSSYSQALKRLNLLAGEINRLNENEEGISLFGEQKKFVLKTPKPAPQEPAAAPPPPAEPPAVPSPELPASPIGQEELSPEMGMEMEPPVDSEIGGEEMSPEMGGEMGGEMGMEDEVSQGGEKVTFKTVQKLTGKLTQKIRELDSEVGLTSENMKYVINMVLSSFDLASLSEEDKEDILSKFEESEEDFGGEDITSDTEVEDIQSDMDIPVPSDAGEMAEMESYNFNKNRFSESKVDEVISKYFEMTKKEILEHKQTKLNRIQEHKIILNKKMKSVINMSETIEQEISSQKFLEENINYTLVGKTNKKNLVFERNGKQVKITPQGFVI
jgi:hypothetical protein